eukprot:767568-Hanusia_phi.AAC.1
MQYFVLVLFEIFREIFEIKVGGVASNCPHPPADALLKTTPTRPDSHLHLDLTPPKYVSELIKLTLFKLKISNDCTPNLPGILQDPPFAHCDTYT